MASAHAKFKIFNLEIISICVNVCEIINLLLDFFLGVDVRAVHKVAVVFHHVVMKETLQRFTNLDCK